MTSSGLADEEKQYDIVLYDEYYFDLLTAKVTGFKNNKLTGILGLGQ